jgi:hypothetical protein
MPLQEGHDKVPENKPNLYDRTTPARPLFGMEKRAKAKGEKLVPLTSRPKIRKVWGRHKRKIPIRAIQRFGDATGAEAFGPQGKALPVRLDTALDL